MEKTRDEVIAQLKVLDDDLLGCWTGALKEFVEQYNERRVKLSKRSESSIINDLAIAEVDRRFGDSHPYARARRKGNLRYVDVDIAGARFVLRFKKLSCRLTASGIATQSVMSFITQQQLDLPNVEKPVNLFVGYTPTEGSLLDSRIYVVCPNGFSVAWHWELTKTAAVVELADEQRAASKPGRRVQPKKQPRTKVGDDGNGV